MAPKQQKQDIAKVGLLYAYGYCINEGKGQEESFDLLKDQLSFCYPLPKKYKSSRSVTQFREYRGMLCIMERVLKSPDILQRAYVKRIMEHGIFPTFQMVKHLYTMYKEEGGSKIEPGPKFLAEFERRKASI